MVAGASTGRRRGIAGFLLGVPDGGVSADPADDDLAAADRLRVDTDVPGMAKAGDREMGNDHRHAVRPAPAPSSPTPSGLAWQACELEATTQTVDALEDAVKRLSSATPIVSVCGLGHIVREGMTPAQYHAAGGARRAAS